MTDAMQVALLMKLETAALLKLETAVREFMAGLGFPDEGWPTESQLHAWANSPLASPVEVIAALRELDQLRKEGKA